MLGVRPSGSVGQTPVGGQAVSALGQVLDHRVTAKSAGKKANDQQDDEQEEEELCDAGSTRCDPPESEDASDNGQNEKCECPVKHRIAPCQ